MLFRSRNPIMTAEFDGSDPVSAFADNDRLLAACWTRPQATGMVLGSGGAMDGDQSPKGYHVRASTGPKAPSPKDTLVAGVSFVHNARQETARPTLALSHPLVFFAQNARQFPRGKCCDTQKNERPPCTVVRPRQPHNLPTSCVSLISTTA